MTSRLVSDFLRIEPVVGPYRNRVRLFRYPSLKEGDTAEKRDRFRALLREHGYRVGHVTSTAPIGTSTSGGSSVAKQVLARALIGTAIFFLPT
jgi:hypothetical protein